jgi:hypothetical protein
MKNCRQLGQALTMNSLFLTPENRALLDQLMSLLAPVCAADARFALNPAEKLEPLYESVHTTVRRCIDALHDELCK